MYFIKHVCNNFFLNWQVFPIVSLCLCGGLGCLLKAVEKRGWECYAVEELGKGSSLDNLADLVENCGPVGKAPQTVF